MCSKEHSQPAIHVLIAARHQAPDSHANVAVYRTQSGLVITLRAKRIAALRARLHAGNMLFNLRGHNLLLQACKQRFALCYRQSHASRRDFLRPLDNPHVVFDGLPGTTSPLSVDKVWKGLRRGGFGSPAGVYAAHPPCKQAATAVGRRLRSLVKPSSVASRHSSTLVDQNRLMKIRRYACRCLLSCSDRQQAQGLLP